jgi:PAS domain S-box-containing protein
VFTRNVPGRRPSDAVRDTVERPIDGVDVVAFFERSQRPMLLADDDRAYLDANDPALELLGVHAEELRRLRIDDIATPEQLLDLDEAWTAFLRLGAAAGTYDVVRSDGRLVRVDFTAVAHVAPGVHLTLWVPVGNRRFVRAAEREDATGAPLTGREREVLRMLARGQDGPQIAEALVLSPATVRTHVNNAMRKLGAHNRAHAMALAIRRGLVEP